MQNSSSESQPPIDTPVARAEEQAVEGGKEEAEKDKDAKKSNVALAVEAEDTPEAKVASSAAQLLPEQEADADADLDTAGHNDLSEQELVDPNSTAAALTEERWEEMFQRLLQFKDIHGHCLVPNRYREDAQLGAWVAYQRKNYKLLQNGSSRYTSMTPERAKRLVDVGFEWTAKNPRHLMWEVRFAELKDFKARYGHVQVPIGWEQNVQLANWVSTQRQEYKNLIKGKTSRLNDRRVHLLESIGFAWELQRGGRRRRLTVSSPDAQEGGTAGQSSKNNSNDAQPSNDDDAFAVEDPNSPPPSSTGGRRRTTLKKKALADPESGRCILPGVAVIGGGIDARRPSPNRRRTSKNAPVAADSPSRQALNATSNEALMRALGNTNNDPFQMMPAPGSYQHQHLQQQQQQNAFAHHLINSSSQQPMVNGPHPYFNMAGQYGVSPFAGNMGGRGMDPPHQYPNAAGFYPGLNMPEMQQTQRYSQRPSQVASSYTEGKSMEESDQQYGAWQGGGSQQAPQWGSPDQNNAAAAAAQHLQAAAALAAGMDERSLPPELAPLASIARRMNTQHGDYSGGWSGSVNNNMAPIGMPPPNFQQQFQIQQAVRRGRIGDPPADPPSDGYGNASLLAAAGSKRGTADDPDPPKFKKRQPDNDPSNAFGDSGE